MAKPSAPKVEVVRFVRPYPHLEGNSASFAWATRSGRHCAYDVTRCPDGVELRKDGKVTFVPWVLVQQIEYSDA